MKVRVSFVNHFAFFAKHDVYTCLVKKIKMEVRYLLTNVHLHLEENSREQRCYFCFKTSTCFLKKDENKPVFLLQNVGLLLEE